MQPNNKYKNKRNTLIDGSLLITESMVKSGADAFIGYPITPSNLLYQYGAERFPVFLAAPDEISTLQWMAGFAGAGKIPVTATSFPGFALMLESINMVHLMELPMVIILVQRLGPSTGTATCGAQGDISLINGMISGGYPIPTFCISNFEDCWELSAKAVQTAVKFRTPVILLSSKEMVMTLRNFDVSKLSEILPVEKKYYNKSEPYKPYKPEENLVPEFLPLGNEIHQVRITSSTHDQNGILQNISDEAIQNTIRIQRKLEHNIKDITLYEFLEVENAKNLLIAFDLTAEAARDAHNILIKEGIKTSLLIPKTLFPVPDDYSRIIKKYKNIFVAEENLNGQYKQILFGNFSGENVRGINSVAKMISPLMIVNEVKSYGI